MKKRIGRGLLLGAAGLMALALAVGPRKAVPAVPAQPVGNCESPLRGKVILVDAGHGGDDGGAKAKDSGVWEKEINLRVALLLREALENRGAEVVMTREKDMQYDAQKRADLTARLALARERHADMLLCVHMNEYRNRAESGPQVFYRAGQERSRLLAGAIQEAMIRLLQPKKQRQALAGDYFMLSLDIPSVLIECGFLSNSAEEKLLLTEEYRARVAEAICAGAEEYCRLTEKKQDTD